MNARVLAALAALAAAGVVSGCGLTDKDKTSSTNTNTQTTKRQVQVVKLPQRPKGVVAVDGSTSGSLTPSAVDRFGRTGTPGVTITVGDAGNTAGFQRFCRGQIDVADSSRAISQSERRLCSRNGIRFVELQAASEAVVITTKNERDVGADCLSLRQVKDTYERGSLITNWQDLNPVFFDVPLHTTGPDENSNEFDFFGNVVLGTRGDTTLADFRKDYVPHSNPDDVRGDVVHHRKGWLGIFRFSYYEQFEEQLRPLELDNGRGNRCVFPSQATITSGLFPLSRRLLLYTSTQALQRPEVKAFLRNYLQRALDLATGSRLVPLPIPVQAEQLKKIGLSKKEIDQVVQSEEQSLGATDQTGTGNDTSGITGNEDQTGTGNTDQSGGGGGQLSFPNGQ
jgi:phosphate transport system substrate-binding protein